MKKELKEQMEIFRKVLDQCLEEELGMPKDDSYESEGRDNILRVLMPQIEVLFLDALDERERSDA